MHQMKTNEPPLTLTQQQIMLMQWSTGQTSQHIQKRSDKNQTAKRLKSFQILFVINKQLYFLIWHFINIVSPVKQKVWVCDTIVNLHSFYFSCTYGSCPLELDEGEPNALNTTFFFFLTVFSKTQPRNSNYFKLTA